MITADATEWLKAAIHYFCQCWAYSKTGQPGNTVVNTKTKTCLTMISMAMTITDHSILFELRYDILLNAKQVILQRFCPANHVQLQ